MERHIMFWLTQSKIKLMDYYTYETSPAMTFYKIPLNRMSDNEKILVARIDKLVADKHNNRGIDNKYSARLAVVTDAGITGYVYITLYDGYYYIGLGYIKH